jgi:nitrate reductase delta subunit
MKTFLVLSLLLEYPSAECITNIDALENVLREESCENGGAARTLAPLMESFRTTALLSLEMQYMDTFENRRGHSLFLYEHLYGEDAARGLALSNLFEKYASHNFVPKSGELPDYIPDILEYFSLLSKEELEKSLGRTIHLFALLKDNLKKSESLYAPVFEVLEHMSPIVPQPMEVLL